MTKPNDGGPAFPSEQGHCPDGTWNQTYESGMTLLDYFAAHAPALGHDVSDESIAEFTGMALYEKRPVMGKDEQYKDFKPRFDEWVAGRNAWEMEARARWRWQHAQVMLRVRSDYVGEQQ